VFRLTSSQPLDL